jgi:hypothetical protein
MAADRLDVYDPFAKESPTRIPGREQPKQTTVGNTRPQQRMRLHIHSSVATQVISTGVEVVITFNTADFDTAGIWASNRFTVPSAGKITGPWQLHGYATWPSVAGGTVREIRWRKNGTTVVRTKKVGPSLLITSDATILINDPNPGDYYELVAFQNSGGDITLQKEPEAAAVEVIHLW